MARVLGTRNLADWPNPLSSVRLIGLVEVLHARLGGNHLHQPCRSPARGGDDGHVRQWSSSMSGGESRQRRPQYVLKRLPYGPIQIVGHRVISYRRRSAALDLLGLSISEYRISAVAAVDGPASAVAECHLDAVCLPLTGRPGCIHLGRRPDRVMPAQRASHR